MRNILNIFNTNRWKAFFRYEKGLRKLINSNNVLDAAELFLESIKLHPTSPTYNAMYGITLVKLNNCRLGIDYLLKAIELGIDKTFMASEVYGYLGLAYFELKDFDNALKKLEKSLALWRDSTSRITKPMLYQNLGTLYRWKGKLDKSIDMYKKLIQIDPNKGESHLLLGIVYSEYFKDNQARQEVEEAVKLDPSLRSKYKEIDQILSH